MRVLNFQRMSTEDGPGLRTTLFVKGCPLSCKWCHNPESIPPACHVEWVKARCMGCRSCLSACKHSALTLTTEGIYVDFNKCLACGDCVTACPTGAMEKKGIDMTVAEVYSELIKDRAYWGAEGGVTLSGGEILLQAAEAAELLKLMKKDGVHTAVDTGGFCARKNLEAVYPYADLFLYDLKIADDERHKHFVGQSNVLIRDNFDYLAEKCYRDGKKLWVRTPIIPSATDDEDNIVALAKFIGSRADLWELCAFNNLCIDKYERLHKDWDYGKEKLISGKKLEKLVKIAAVSGTEVKGTGLTQKEENHE